VRREAAALEEVMVDLERSQIMGVSAGDDVTLREA
jgi:hypothetical protein